MLHEPHQPRRTEYRRHQLVGEIDDMLLCDDEPKLAHGTDGRRLFHAQRPCFPTECSDRRPKRQSETGLGGLPTTAQFLRLGNRRERCFNRPMKHHMPAPLPSPLNASSRRRFLRRTAQFTAAATLAPMIVPGRVLGLDGEVSPSNRITMGFIGTGRQSTHVNLPGFLHQPDAQVVAVCDVDAWRMEQARRLVEKTYAGKTASGTYKGCLALGDWREVMARKDIDAVMIGTPDHWHTILTIAAAKAGKDISCEKPPIRHIAEGRKMVQTVQKHGRVFCTDSEFRAMRWCRMLAMMARNGKFGRLRRIITQVPPDPTIGPQPEMPVPPELNYDLWLGPAPVAPYTEKRVHPRHNTRGRPGWLCLQDYADGIMANWGSHWNDIAMWAMDMERRGPTAVQATATFPPPGNFWNVMLTLEAHCWFPNGVELVCRTGKPMIRIEGEEGWGQITYPAFVEFHDDSLMDWKPGPHDIELPRMVSEKRDFLDAVKTRRQPQYDAEQGVRVNTLALLANASIALGGRRLEWDEKREVVLNDEEANKWLQPKPMRAPWHVL